MSPGSMGAPIAYSKDFLSRLGGWEWLGSAHPTPEGKDCGSHRISTVFPLVKDGGKPGPSIQGQPLALPVEPLLWHKKPKASIRQNDARLQPAAQTLLGASSTCPPPPRAMTRALYNMHYIICIIYLILFIACLYVVLFSAHGSRYKMVESKVPETSKGC